MSNSDKVVSFLRRNAIWLALLVIIVVVGVLGRIFLPDLLKPARLLPSPFGGELVALPTATPLPPPTVTISSIRAAAELATVEYQAVAEVPNERVPDDFRQYLGVREHILLIAYGEVKAGFDLSKLREGDLWTDGTRVQLHLPAPEILSSSIDFERTHVVYYQKSLLVEHDPNLGQETLDIAEDAIHQAAMEADVLENAAKYGQLFFENFLRSLGFTEVQVIVD
jgi:hypothetical protein